MKKAIIIIIAVIVVLGGAFAGLYFFTDVFNFLKPASDNFSIQVDKLLGSEENLSYSEYEENINKLKQDSSYTSDFNMSMNISLPSSYISYSNQKLINSSKLNLKTSYDADSKAMSADIKLSKDNSEVIAASAIVDGEKVSINSKDLYDKYITIDLNKYESFCQANNIEPDKDLKESIEALSKMNTIDTNSLAYDLYYVSEEDYKALEKNYGNILTDYIDKDNYTTKKNQKITVGDEDVKTTAYSLTLSGKDAYNFLDKLITQMKDDSTLKNLIINKYNVIKKYQDSYAEISSDSDLNTQMPELKESDLDTFFSNLIKDLEESKDDFEDIEKNIKLTIYSDKKSNPVKFEVAILDDEDDKEGTVIFTEELEEGKNTYKIELDKLSKLSGNKSSSSSSSYTNSSSSSLTSALGSLSQIIIVDEYESTDDSRKGTITVSAKASGRKEEMLKIEYDFVNSKSELKAKLSMSSPLSTALSLDFNYDVTGLDTDTQKLEFSMSGKYSIYSVSFDINGTMKSGADITKLSDSNSVDLFALSSEEFVKLYTDVITNAANNLPSKLSKYGVKVTKEQILSAIPTTTTPEDTTTQNPEGTTENSNTEATEQPAA